MASSPSTSIVAGLPSQTLLQARAWPWRHVALPLVVAVLASVLLMGFGGDAWWADHLYAWQGGAWRYRSSFLLQTLLHDDARRLLWAAWLGLAAMVLVSRRGRLQAWHRALRYLLVATLTSVSLVALLKGLTHVDCPWDLARYGGAFAGRGLFELHAADPGPGRCFPAGHASAGYAWVALYFACAAVRPQWRRWGLLAGLGLGLLFGAAQQLRGAHFLSHDVWALTLCWISSAVLARWMLPRALAGGA